MADGGAVGRKACGVNIQELGDEFRGLLFH